jgi:hypothetical protein
MRRPTLLENLVANLEGNVPTWSDLYLPREVAYRYLKAMLGQDLGMDAKAWRAWLDALNSAEGIGDGHDAS